MWGVDSLQQRADEEHEIPGSPVRKLRQINRVSPDTTRGRRLRRQCPPPPGTEPAALPASPPGTCITPTMYHCLLFLIPFLLRGWPGFSGYPHEASTVFRVSLKYCAARGPAHRLLLKLQTVPDSPSIPGNAGHAVLGALAASVPTPLDMLPHKRTFLTPQFGRDPVSGMQWA